MIEGKLWPLIASRMGAGSLVWAWGITRVSSVVILDNKETNAGMSSALSFRVNATEKDLGSRQNQGSIHYDCADGPRGTHRMLLGMCGALSMNFLKARNSKAATIQKVVRPKREIKYCELQPKCGK